MMIQLRVLSLCLSLVFVASNDVIISEIAEGSSNNKYIEIYNPNNASVALAGVALAHTTNDPSTPGQHESWFDLSSDAILEAGDTYLIAHTSADPSILALANQTLSLIHI